MSLAEYFEQVDCPAVENLSASAVAGICLHIQSRVEIDGRKVLSLGCGDGRIEAALFDVARPKILTGIDISERHLKIARRRLPEAEFIQADLRNFSAAPFGTYDLVLAISVAQYLTADELKNLHAKLFDVLAADGKIFYFNVPDKRRKFLYRINNAVVMEDWKYLLPSRDFIDEFSRWHARSSFRAAGYRTKFFTPSYCWERFDALLQKISSR
ncbi:MAG: class I SAM-dependent methyltransferase [Quinella sp. 1Q7]|nr:class I SAM-dependent methyltransferase [Quinella sp. 1Q7]